MIKYLIGYYNNFIGSYMVHSRTGPKAPRVAPFAVESAIRALGGHIAEARKRRRMTQQDLASRAGVSRQTIIRLEGGNPRVELAAAVAALWAMDLHHEIGEIAALEHDAVGATLAQARLGTRVRASAADVDDDF